SFLCVFSWLTIPSWFGWHAEVLLGAGVAVQTANLAIGRPDHLLKLLRFLTGWVRPPFVSRRVGKTRVRQFHLFGHAHGALFTAVVLILLLLVGVGTNRYRDVQEQRALINLAAPPLASPNVLLLVWDTVRARNVGLYG